MSVSVAELDKIISETREAREVKRALCVKMSLGSLPVSQICELLNVSASFVSKWRGIYEAQGAAGLGLRYIGSQSFLTPAQRSAAKSSRGYKARPVKARAVKARAVKAKLVKVRHGCSRLMCVISGKLATGLSIARCSPTTS